MATFERVLTSPSVVFQGLRDAPSRHGGCFCAVMPQTSETTMVTVTQTPERCGRGLSLEGHERLRAWLTDARSEALSRMRPDWEARRPRGSESRSSGVPSRR